MEHLLDKLQAGPHADELERQVIKLRKINAALMQRVERSMEQQANAYSLFQTAITLEGQVRVRTEELKSALSRLERTNEELTSARDTSERANRFKTRFFTAVGHDLLQPLHAARLSASALTEPSGNVDQRRIADRIEHALTTIEDLLKSILDISKLEAGAITPARRPVPLDELFTSLSVDIEPLARKKNLSLTWRRTDLSVLSDPMMLRRILQNLMANAVQYTQHGGIRLLARRRGSNVRIEVWDTGPGIAPDDREMIFEEFQRGPAADRAAIGGFGLGLSIVQRMAEALGHPFDMCSRVGHGTRFSISAPFAGIAEPRAAQSAPANPAFSYGLGGVKVAVLDNDTYVLEAMQSLLESWRCEVCLLQSVSDLDGLIESGFRPAILLVDYHLDGGGCGLTAVARARLAMGDDAVAGIVITADHSPSVADAARFAGCELLLKPVKPAELRALMRHLTSKALEAQPQ